MFDFFKKKRDTWTDHRISGEGENSSSFQRK